MEHVAFLIESSGDLNKTVQRLRCMLNPESLVQRRRAGVQQRKSTGGLVTGADLADDRLLYSGGGSTELALDLLFDTCLPGSTITSGDVRDLTAPIWALAENTERQLAYARPQLCRFVWGKNLYFRGIVTHVAERLEYFSSTGLPRRSWLRLRMLRVMESAKPRDEFSLDQPMGDGTLNGATQKTLGERIEAVELTSSEYGQDEDGLRLDLVAANFYDGDAAMWRAIAHHNDLDDPTHFPPDYVLEVPR